MRLAYIAPMCLFVTACNKPVVIGCEEFIKSQLKAPSTYRRIEVREYDEAKTYDQMVSLGMFDRVRVLARILHRPVDPKEMSEPQNLHTVLVTYEANNSYNTPLRDRALCAFAVDKGDSPDKLIVDVGVHGAISRAETRSLIEAGVRENDGKVDMDPAYPCCL